MRYYQYNKYPIEFVVSEDIDKYFAPHNHAGHYIISVVLQGEAVVILENRKSECSEGDMFIVPPYAIHSVYQGKDARLLSMCIGTSFVEGTVLETAEGIIRDLLRDVAIREAVGTEQEEKLLSSVRVVYCLREKGGKEINTEIQALTYKIARNPEQEMPIEVLAADIFVSKYYFIRKFKNYVGMTPHQFCIQNRIRKSQRLLDAEKTISEISAEMGFYDQSHFNKAFHRIVGISPSEYVHSKKYIQ